MKTNKHTADWITGEIFFGFDMLLCVSVMTLPSPLNARCALCPGPNLLIPLEEKHCGNFEGITSPLSTQPCTRTQRPGELEGRCLLFTLIYVILIDSDHEPAVSRIYGSTSGSCKEVGTASLPSRGEQPK